ncbi:hypothetical protein ACFQ4Q_22495 [Lysobacter gummosus]|uniref:hypothetical protein n=2 Tax=Lysobacter gummosus TaxID=262324 RepID=UPI0036438CD2
MKPGFVLMLIWAGACAAPCVHASAPPAPQAGAPAATAEQLATAETDHIHLQEFDARQRFAANHPNELHRLYGSEAAGKGQWGDAAVQFRRAARYADKYSQHRLSLMYWHGLGVRKDPALAYAWADLAAERLYPQFVLIREKMWQEMDEAERARALREGGALFDEYADAVAKPRFERAVARARANMTGSRAGAANGQLMVFATRDGDLQGSNFIDLKPMYAGWRLDPKRYWAVEDVVWQQGGNVEVGPLDTLIDQGRP